MSDSRADPISDKLKLDDLNEEPTEMVAIGEVSAQPKDHSYKKPFSTLKEENDKLRTYLGLVKMCNNSAINKIRSAINETMGAIHSANETPIEANVIIKQLEVIQNEIMNMQSMHTQLDEGIEAFQVIDNPILRTTDDATDTRETMLLVTTRHEVPRKSTGIRKTITRAAQMRSKSVKTNQREDPGIEAKLLSRVVDKQYLKGVTTFDDNSLTNIVPNEEREAVSNLDLSAAEDRENLSHQVSEQTVKTQPYVLTTRITKKPYISEEFKSSHLQRLEEAKRRREEMNRQLEREGKRRPKPNKRSDEQIRDISDSGKKSPKKKAIKKKTIGKVTKKRVQSQPIATAQSIVVPISQSTLESLSGQTIQIIASGGTQILCRNDGTFIPATNTTQWQTGNTQWTATTATDANSFTQNQWNQYQT